MKTSFLFRITAGAIILLGLSGASLVFAQTAPSTIQTVVSWHAANSYVPPGYFAKVLPNFQSPITASVEVFSNGSLVSIKSNTVYWYLNNTLIGGGPGAQSITFSLFGGQLGDQNLQVQIPDYPGGLLIKTIPIPVMQPMVVINAPFAGATFSENPLVLSALPYFFNVTSSDDLSFAWSVNGVAGTNTENPEYLQINLPQGTPSGSSFAVSLQVTDAADSTTATNQQTLTYEPLP